MLPKKNTRQIAPSLGVELVIKSRLLSDIEVFIASRRRRAVFGCVGVSLEAIDNKIVQSSARTLSVVAVGSVFSAVAIVAVVLGITVTVARIQH